MYVLTYLLIRLGDVDKRFSFILASIACYRGRRRYKNWPLNFHSVISAKDGLIGVNFFSKVCHLKCVILSLETITFLGNTELDASVTLNHTRVLF